DGGDLRIHGQGHARDRGGRFIRGECPQIGACLLGGADREGRAAPEQLTRDARISALRPTAERSRQRRWVIPRRAAKALRRMQAIDPTEEEPRVPFRTVLLSAAGLWLCYFALATLRWEVFDLGYTQEMLQRR